MTVTIEETETKNNSKRNTHQIYLYISFEF